MSPTALAAERIRSLDISLNGLPVGTLVRTPGDYSAFNLLPAYRSLKNPPIFSLSLRSADKISPLSFSTNRFLPFQKAGETHPFALGSLRYRTIC